MSTALALLALIGLTVSFLGAALAAYAVLLSPEEAAQIGVSRWADEDQAENVRQPLPQALLRQSRLAAGGLAAVAAGTLLQALAVGLAI